MAGWLARRWRSEGPLLALILTFLLAGLTLGLAAPSSVDEDTLARTRLSIGNYIQTLPEAGIDPVREFQQALALNGGLIAGIGLAGLHLLGLPLIAALLFCKGLSLGYAMGFLIDYQGASGFAIIFLSMLPQNLLLLPLFVLAAFLAARTSFSLLRAQALHGSTLGFYCLRFGVLLAGAALAGLVQAYLCPLLLRMLFVVL